MACCSNPNRVRLERKLERSHESCIAERVTELISQRLPAEGSRGWDRHLPVVIVPGMCSSGLKVLESVDQPSWENDRIWLSMQKLSMNQVQGGLVGSMQQVQPATVTVLIDRARNLAACDANGTSDPYVKVAMLDADGALTSRMYQTSVQTKTLSPEWEEDFLIGTRSNVDEASCCLVEVMDKDAMGVDDMLGRLEFSMTSIKAGEYAQLSWHELKQSPGSEFQAKGSLLLSIQYEPAPAPEPASAAKPPPTPIEDMFSKLSPQEALEACEDLGIEVTEGETTLLNMQAAVRAYFADSKHRNPRAVFGDIDTDGNGVLDREEIMQAAAMLGFLLNREQASEAFAEMDANNDNEISVQEFESWWGRHQAEVSAMTKAQQEDGGGIGSWLGLGGKSATPEAALEAHEGEAGARPCPWASRVADARTKLLRSSAWVRHMCLAEDGQSDPVGIKVRAFRGLPGVAYLQAGAMSPFTWVFAKVIDHLCANGYEKNKNLMACPYDWRLALRWQEERDGYFSQLKQTIEHAKTTNAGRPVVLLAHSMGNRTVHYFLNWVLNTQDDAQRWLDEHVHSFFAAAAPFLGSSAAFRGAMLGEDFGIGAFINQDLATILCRSCSAGPEVFPVGPLASIDDRTTGCDLAYSRYEGRLTIDVLSADLTQSAGHPLAVQFDVEHSRIKNHRRLHRSVKTRNNFVDGSKSKHGGVDFYQRFQFVTEDVDINRATGEELTVTLRFDKHVSGKFSLPVADWFMEARSGTLHVKGIGEQYRGAASLHERFQRYGAVAAVTVRQKFRDKPSWALVTFKEDAATGTALSDEGALGADGLHVTLFDMARRVQSTGEMGTVLQEHRQKLRGSGSGHTRHNSMRGISHSGEASEEIIDLELDLVTKLFRHMAVESWSYDRWENLQLKAFCFAGREALEWLQRWLFENDLPHSHTDALHLGHRLMDDGVFAAVSSSGARGTHGSSRHSARLRADGLYQLTEGASTGSPEQVQLAGRGRMSLTLGEAHGAITPGTGVYVVGTCGAIRRCKAGEKLVFDTSATPGGDIVVTRQESIEASGSERTSGYGEIALRPNHGQDRWSAETEMRLKPIGGHNTLPDTITVALEWELLQAASDGEVVDEDGSSPRELDSQAADNAHTWCCMGEIEPSVNHPKLHPDDDSLDASPEETTRVGYRTVRLQDTGGTVMAELHIVVTFEGPPTHEPKKFDDHCPYEYNPRDMHEMLTRHGAGNCVDIHEGSKEDPNGLQHGTIFKAPPCKRIFHTYGINLDTEVGYFFKHMNGVELMPSGPKSSCGVELDRTASMSDLNFKVKSGVIFETKTTRRNIEDVEIPASGDGTVPYMSLRYSKEWDSPICRSEIVEIDNSEHREILADSRFHNVLLEYLSETLVCYVLEGRGFTLSKGRPANPYVVGTLQYAGGLSSVPQKTESFHRQPRPLFKTVMCFGAGTEHLGGPAAACSLEGPDQDGPAQGTVPGATESDTRGSHPAIGVQFQVFSARQRPLHDEMLGVVYVALEEVLASPTRAIQAWYTVLESNEQGSGRMKLRLHVELEESGQSYRGKGKEEAIAAALEQNTQHLEPLPK